MVFKVTVGSFVLNTGTGNQTISGLPVDPQAIIFMANKVTSETAAVDTSQSYGLTDGTRSKVGGVSTDDGATNTDRVQTETEIINLMNPTSGAVEVRCSLVSLGTAQFVINVGTNTSSEAILVRYVIYSGLVNVRVDQVNVDLSPVTSLTFQPNVLIAITTGQGPGDLTTQFCINSMIGCAERFSGSTRQWWLADFRGENDRLQVCGQVRDTAFIGQYFNAALSWELSLTSFDTNGFTWSGTDGVDVMYYLAMELPSGIEAFASTFQKATGTAPVTQALPDATGFTNNVQAYILATQSNANAKTDAAERDSLGSIGAYSEADAAQWNISEASELTGTQADMVSDDDAVLYEMGLGASKVSTFTPVAITDTQPDVTLDPNSATAIWVGYLAFENDIVVVEITHTTDSLLSELAFEVVGNVKDLNLSSVGTVRCILLKHDGAAIGSRIYVVIDHQNANGSGDFTFPSVADNDSRYVVLGYKVDTPDVRGVTNDDVTPTSV